MIELHASTLPYYTDCPRRASTKIFFKEIESKGYKLKRFDFRNISANIGTACHSGAEISLTQHDRKQAISASLDKLSDLNKDVKFDAVSPNQNTAQKQTERITKSYYINVAEKIEPLFIEKRLEARINDDFILSGQSDVITNDIRDFKTGKNAQCQAQIGAYSLLVKANSIPVDAVFVDWLQNARLNKPQEYHEIRYDLDVCERLAKDVINRIISDYEAFEFPCNNNSMLCSKTWCRAYGTDYCEVTQ